MAKTIGTSDLLDVWASSGAKVEPVLEKKEQGWALGEQPPHEFMNWLQATFGEKLNHILANGVPAWNDATDYEAGAVVNHSGSVWQATIASTDSEPSALNEDWASLLAAGGEVEVPSSAVSYNNAESGLAAEDVQAAIDEVVATKQDTLVSGDNIKTINGVSPLGAGNIAIAAGWKPYVIAESGTFNLTAGKEYFVVAVGAGGSGAAQREGTRGCASGGGGGGVASLGIPDASAISLVITIGAGGAGRSRSGTAGTSGGLAGGATTVTGSGISTLTASGGSGGIGSSGTSGVSGVGGGSATGGDFNYSGGSSGDVSLSGTNIRGASGGGSILGSGSAVVTTQTGGSAGAGMASSGGLKYAQSGLYSLFAQSLNYVPSSIDLLTATALRVLGDYVGQGSGGQVGSGSDGAATAGATLGAGSGAAHCDTADQFSTSTTGDGGNGIVIILEKL